MKTTKTLLLLIALVSVMSLNAHSKKRVIIDIAHDQRFWNNPATMKQKDQQLYERARYLTSEMKKVTAALGADFTFQTKRFDAESLAKCDLLFIPGPSSQFSKAEALAINRYLQNGGSMFLVMDEDFWSTLKQTKVNELIRPFGVEFGGQSPDTINGGYSKAGPITPETLRIPFHGARLVTGGTPFCFNKQSEKFPYGVYKQLQGGGKLIVMGDGMASLFMTSWKGEGDYKCHDFMRDSFKWLMEK